MVLGGFLGGRKVLNSCPNGRALDHATSSSLPMQPEIAITDRITENCQNFVNININPQNIELLDLDSFHKLLAVAAQRPQNLELT
jgi:hypothetical protein